MVQLSHLYTATRKTIAWTIRTLVGKMMVLLFNILSKVCHSFPSKEQVSFNFTTIVIVHNDLEFKKIKIFTVSDFSLSICHEVMGPDAMIFFEF